MKGISCGNVAVFTGGTENGNESESENGVTDEYPTVLPESPKTAYDEKNEQYRYDPHEKSGGNFGGVIDFKIGDYRVGQGFGNQHTERFEKAVDNTAQIERSVFGSPRIYLCNGLEITALPDT